MSLDSNTVARVGDRAITLETFKSELSRRSPGRNKEQVLDGLLQFELLLAQAKAEGLEREPEFVESFNRLLVSRFQEKAWERLHQELPEPSAEEVRRHYEATQDQFTTPESRRAGVIFLKSNPRAEPARKNEIRTRARSILQQAEQASHVEFTRLVQQHSEDQSTRYQGGDAGWLNQTPNSGRWEGAVIKAIFQIDLPGHTAPLLETARGFYIIRLLQMNPPRVRPLEDVADGVRYHLTQQRQQEIQQTFLNGLRARLNPQINRPLLDSIEDPAGPQENRPASLPAL